MNTLNSGSLDTLNPGQCLIVQAREVANGKVQLECAEKLNSGRDANPLSVFNSSDKRFTSNARRAWLTVEPSDAESLLELPAGTLTEGYSENGVGHSVKPLNILTPNVSGTNLRVQITETIEPTEYQMMNLESAAKRRGKDGDFITCDGKYIFSNSDVVFGEPTHTFLASDAQSAHAGIEANMSFEGVTADGEILS